MPRLWTLGNLCRRRPRGTLESPPRPPVLHCAPEATSHGFVSALRAVRGLEQAKTHQRRFLSHQACRSDSFTVRQNLSGAKVRQSHGFAGLPAGSFEPVSLSHPLNFKGKFRTATPASHINYLAYTVGRDEKLAGKVETLSACFRGIWNGWSMAGHCFLWLTNYG